MKYVPFLLGGMAVLGIIAAFGFGYDMGLGTDGTKRREAWACGYLRGVDVQIEIEKRNNVYALYLHPSGTDDNLGNPKEKTTIACKALEIEMAVNPHW